MEETTEVMSKIYDFKYLILRPHNVYGPRMSLNDPYRNVIGIFINCLLKKKPFYIYGDGNQKRAFTFIEDLIPYMAKAGWIDIDGEIINLGPEQICSINKLAGELLKHFPDGPRPIHLPKRPQEVRDVYATDSKAKRLLGYKSKINLKTGLKKTLDWAKSIGPSKTIYLDHYELEKSRLPKTWKDKLI